MKSVKEYIITESNLSKEKKEEIINFVEDYFDKFDKDPKNFLKHKFEKKTNYDFFGWSIESLLHSKKVPHGHECTNLLVSLHRKEISGKKMPDYWSGNYILTSYMKLKAKRNSLIKRYLGAYKVGTINKRQKDPELLYQHCLRDYVYITNFENNKKILEDPGFLEIYDFTDSKDYEYIEESDKGITVKVFLWNKYWPIIRFDFKNIDEGLKINSSTNIYKDVDYSKFIICIPGNFVKLNLEQ